MSEAEGTKEKQSLPPRTYGCAKCGSPIQTYPPDDVHKVASRERASFLQVIEANYTCAKCNEVTRLYWGKPVLYRGLVVGLRGLFQGMMGIVGMAGKLNLKRGGAEENGESDALDDSLIDTSDPEELENRIYDYLIQNGGSISVNRASDELGIPTDMIKEVLERMTLDGRLKQPSDAPQMSVA